MKALVTSTGVISYAMFDTEPYEFTETGLRLTDLNRVVGFVSTNTHEIIDVDDSKFDEIDFKPNKYKMDGVNIVPNPIFEGKSKDKEIAELELAILELTMMMGGI